ncbi:MAG: hypothetical protein KDK76_00655 [Chlamydiia bacterium]|nr:hypothetical protein [Chlamydiia bacterium]
MIRLRAEYPWVMKTQIITCIEVSPDWTLDTIKGLILKDFWEKFNTQLPNHTTQHGGIKNVQIVWRQTLIETDQKMQECLTNDPFVNIFFIKNV